MAKKAKAKPDSASQRQKMAFQCRTCNAVFPAEIAGDNDVPLACPHCLAGVTYSPQGIKTFSPGNWIKLADLSEAQLAKGFHVHGLKREHVTKHTGHTGKVTPGAIVEGGSAVTGKDHERTATEALGSHDKV